MVKEIVKSGVSEGMAFVRCREMSASQRLLNYYMYGKFIHSVPQGLSVLSVTTRAGLIRKWSLC